MPARDSAVRSNGSPFKGWDVLPLAAIELTPDGQALRANPAFAALTGLALDGVAGTGWFAALSPDRRAALFAALAARHDFELEIRLLRRDGAKAWIDASARWLPASGSYLCLLHDGTAARQQAQDARAEAERFHLLADHVPVLIAYYERTGNTCTYANPQYAAAFGLDARSILGRTVEQVIGADAARAIQPYVDTLLAERRTVSYVRRLDRGDGAPRWIDVSLVPHLAADGTVVGSFVRIGDITQHREAELAACQSQERLAKFMTASIEGIVLHHDGLITDVNAPIEALYGAGREALIGRHVFDFIAPEFQPRAREVLAAGAELAYEAEIVDVGGQRIPVELIVRTVMHGQERLRLAVVRDLRARRAALQRIRHLTQHDPLTGLLNHTAFVAALDAALAGHRAGGAAFALLLIDLDHFKRVNAAYGHQAGDALLAALAAAMARVLPVDAVSGRYGGDEFGLLLPGVADREQARMQAARVHATLQLPVEIGGHSLATGATIGVARCPHDGADVDALLRCADAALAAGKAAGRGVVRCFEPALAAATRSHAG